jgi:flagellar basal-body rod protein FlgB
MGIGDLPLMSMLKTRMRWHNQRQVVLAENVANADTPGFRARDVRAPVFETVRGAGPVRTDPRHMSGFGSRAADASARAIQSFETTPRGNAVTLEEEMIKVGQNAQDFQAAATLYQRSMGLLRTAMSRRG